VKGCVRIVAHRSKIRCAFGNFRYFVLAFCAL
jgi:hypothetical protein